MSTPSWTLWWHSATPPPQVGRLTRLHDGDQWLQRSYHVEGLPCGRDTRGLTISLSDTARILTVSQDNAEWFDRTYRIPYRWPRQYDWERVGHLYDAVWVQVPEELPPGHPMEAFCHEYLIDTLVLLHPQRCIYDTARVYPPRDLVGPVGPMGPPVVAG